MCTRSNFIVAITFFALVSITAGLCCPPVMAATAEMPMEHGDGHQDHGSLMSCCSAHDTRVQTEVVVLAPPSDAVIVFQSSLEFFASERLSGDEILGWPPGIRDLTSVLCSFII